MRASVRGEAYELKGPEATAPDVALRSLASTVPPADLASKVAHTVGQDLVRRVRIVAGACGRVRCSGMDSTSPRSAESRQGQGFPLRTGGRVVLGVFVAAAGIGHLTSLRQEFQAQVPPWIPLDPDFVVVASGVVEVGLGASLLLAPRALRPAVGWATAAFFRGCLPGQRRAVHDRSRRLRAQQR